MSAGRVTVRFYAELNDFLSADRRQRDLISELNTTRTVKDLIESLGVPHTEVDLILVNGKSAGFARHVEDGDRISVYPVFERLDIGPVSEVRPEPLRRTWFVADVHVAALARRLRLVGFDTVWDPTWTDGDLARISADESRILLTRDRGLLKRRAVTHGLFIRDDEPDEQLLDVIRRLDLSERIRPFTLCPNCNGSLVEVAKERVEDRLPPVTRDRVDRFKECQVCGRLYWRGAHHVHIEELISRIRCGAGDPDGSGHWHRD